ncbi:MAG: sugar ABC transporter substrate-binding protein [Xanthomonadales bacterium]|nr:sugar ABC transporter substrate-binding protein [Xanthomonadales bacterium]
MPFRASAAFTVIAALISTLLALSGCSNESEPVQNKIVVLTFNMPHYKDGFSRWVAEFHKLHPDIEVEQIDRKGSNWGAFYHTQVISGTAPDIIDTQGGAWLQYASQGGLLDLTPFLEKDAEFTANFYPELLQSWIYEGQNYGIPLYFTKTLLFYNKLMFQEAGITSPPNSFDQLMEYAYKMTKGEKSGFMTLNFDWLYWPLFAMNGIDLVTPDLRHAAFNTPKAIALIERLAKATKDGAISNISWTGRWVEPNSMFAAGQIGMLQAHSTALLWMLSNTSWINENTIGFAQMPGNWSTPNAHALHISADSKYPQAAWDFIKIATSGEGAYSLGISLNNLTGDRFVNEKILDYFSQTKPIVVPLLRTQQEHLNTLVGNWPLANDAEIKEALYPELQSALLNHKSAADALSRAEKKVNHILSRDDRTAQSQSSVSGGQ